MDLSPFPASRGAAARISRSGFCRVRIKTGIPIPIIPGEKDIFRAFHNTHPHRAVSVDGNEARGGKFSLHSIKSEPATSRDTGSVCPIVESHRCSDEKRKTSLPALRDLGDVNLDSPGPRRLMIANETLRGPATPPPLAQYISRKQVLGKIRPSPNPVLRKSTAIGLRHN